MAAALFGGMALVILALAIGLGGAVVYKFYKVRTWTRRLLRALSNS
jgi:hypothetical protein